MKKLKQVLYLILILILILNISACNNMLQNTKEEKKVCSDTEKARYFIDYDKYQDAKMYNYNIDISTDNIIEKATELRKKLSQVKNAETESFSSSSNSSNIRMYFPSREADVIDKILSSDPEITNFSRNKSNIGISYIDYAERYYLYKIMLDNFEDIRSIIEKQSCNQIKTSSIRRMLEDNVRNYKNNMDSYKKQINKIYLQIYIRKSTS